jgi:predicted Zn-dependent protease
VKGRRPWGLPIGLAILAILAILGGFGARRLAAHRARAELAEARKEMEAGLLALARKRLTRLIEARPGEAEAAYLLGQCEAARGRPGAALDAWARIPTDSPWAAPAALSFAQAAIPLGRLTDAERRLRAALQRPGPEVPALRRSLLVLLGQQGRLDEARRLIESLWDEPAIVPGTDRTDRLAMLHEHAGLDLEPFPLEGNLGLIDAGPEPAAEGDRRALALARAYLATRSGDFDRAEGELRSCLRRRAEDPTVWRAWLDWAVEAGRVEPAREALPHLPARLFDAGRILELRAWFARQRHDEPAERRLLEELLEIEPGRIASLARLAELLHKAGDPRATTLRRLKDQRDAALDRYLRLYREDHYAEHLPELAELADRLGRTFEARAFRELIGARKAPDPSARSALARSNAVKPPAPPADSASLAEVIDADGALDVASYPGDAKPADRGANPRFEDRASAAGLSEFIQDNGASPNHQLPEMASGGVGLLDYDGDGFLDIYCVQGGVFPPHPNSGRSGDRLYRNRGDGTFLDATRASGIAGMPGGYGHGVAVGDYDNDGRPDLFITRWRSYALYRNRGDGTFEDVTKPAGLDGDRDWPTSSAFADLDNDGDLDLYVCHYGAWDSTNPEICRDPSGVVVVTCDPRRIRSLPDHVFRNEGGRFVDVTAGSGIVDRDGRGLGVLAADLDEDGRIDLFVANDSTANFLFRNRGGFRFEEVGHEAGVAANSGGGYQAGMGVACGDLDGDGRLDLAVTNFYGESTTLFHNLGQGLFADHTAAAALAAPSRYRLGFGVALFDANNDGWLDLMTANGHISDVRPLFPYAMTPQLFLGGPAGMLADVTARAGPPFQRLYVGRGLAVGDLDNDGRLDALMVAQNEPLVDFQNQTREGPGHFIAFRLEGTRSNRDGVGAVVAVMAGGHTRVASRFGGGSFQSAGDPRVHFGLGSSSRVERVEVRWPSGAIDHHRDLIADQVYLLREGTITVGPWNGVRP